MPISKSKIQSYLCPRCGYATPRKQNIERHFIRQVECPNSNNLVLTDEIKTIVLKDRMYHPPKKENQHINIDERKQIPKKIREMVWKTYVGLDTAAVVCWCCKSTMINYFDYSCGHILAKSRGGRATVGNLRPICSLCNSSMGVCDMLEFQETLSVHSDCQKPQLKPKKKTKINATIQNNNVAK